MFDGRTDERTDTTKQTVALRNFANAPKNSLCIDGNQCRTIPLCGYCHTYNNVSTIAFRHFRAQWVAVQEIPLPLRSQQFF